MTISRSVTARYGGQSMPDIVGNIRLEQGWGKLMLSGAVHEIRYPVEIDADYGWAVALGAAFDLPFAAGAYIALEGAYADGAGQYIGANRDSGFSILEDETDLASGWSVTGEIGASVTPDVTIVAFGSYLDVDSTDADDLGLGLLEESYTSWVAGANVTYTLTPGLTLGAEVAYTNTDIDNVDLEDSAESEWSGGVRIKRTF